ncbi:MAG: methyltransferase [Planctomycetaceae bacterium]
MLKFTLSDNGSAHDDMLLQLGTFRQRCDSYFLRVDRHVSPQDESFDKARRVLMQLLQGWRELVADTAHGTPFYLPFDFSDQSTGWIRCTPDRRDLVLQAGTSQIEGWSIPPSQIDSEPWSVPDFVPAADSSPLRAPRSVWLRAIDACIDRAAGNPVPRPFVDPTSIFEHFRGSYGSELLTAAVAHFDLFGILSRQPLTIEDLGRELQLASRPMHVLMTTLRAMGLIERLDDETLVPTMLAEEHLISGGPFDVSDYLGLAASSPGVLEMVARLKTNRPAGADTDNAVDDTNADTSEPGVAFIYRAGQASAMEQSELARHFTLALAGRAKNVAPHLARAVSMNGDEHLLDLGGGTGLYAMAFLQQHPEMRATVLDRPEVLRVAEEMRQEQGLEERLTLLPGDMFADPLPQSDVILLSNILHDWDVAECQELIQKAADALPRGGRLLIHDVLLNDALDGPLPIALYSAALFTLTEGRAYSAAEYQSWMQAAGLDPTPPHPTLIHCTVLTGHKR